MSARRRLATLAALILMAAGPAPAQTRPPEPEARAVPAPRAPATRPPVRPDVAETDAAEDAGAEQSATETPPGAAFGPDAPPIDAPQTDVPTEGDEGAGSAALIGPPAPPAWFWLRGTEADHAACRSALRRAGAIFEELAPVTEAEDADCGIARPLQLSRLTRAVALPGEPVLRCEAALALAQWTRRFVIPAAASLPEAPTLTAIRTGPGYSCRARVGTGAADPKRSEHALGNAVDIMGFEFEDRDPLVVQPRAGDADADEAFQRAARATACLLFTTVLGPGSNAAHDDHLHLDLAQRDSGWRLCD